MYRKGKVPLYTLHVDPLGPMEASAKQYMFILAIVEAFVKFVSFYK